MSIHIMLISFTFGQYTVKLIVTYRFQISQSEKLGSFIGEKLDLSYQRPETGNCPEWPAGLSFSKPHRNQLLAKRVLGKMDHFSSIVLSL